MSLFNVACRCHMLFYIWVDRQWRGALCKFKLLHMSADLDHEITNHLWMNPRTLISPYHCQATYLAYAVWWSRVSAWTAVLKLRLGSNWWSVVSCSRNDSCSTGNKEEEFFHSTRKKKLYNFWRPGNISNNIYLDPRNIEYTLNNTIFHVMISHWSEAHLHTGLLWWNSKISGSHVMSWSSQFWKFYSQTISPNTL